MLLIFTFLSFFHSVFIFQEPEVKALRQLFYEARDSEKKADELYGKMKDYEGKEGIMLSYKAGAHALKAKHGGNPVSKLQHVKKARKYFSEAVNQDPQNLEIRFMRYAVEVQTPVFLGYSEHVPEDKSMLLQGLRNYPKSSLDQETARIARDFMKGNCSCSAEEKAFLDELKL